MADTKTLREQMATLAMQARDKIAEISDVPEDRAAEIEREFDAMMTEPVNAGTKFGGKASKRRTKKKQKKN